MKNLIIFSSISFLLCTGGVAIKAHITSDDFLNANAEALLESRSLPDITVNCFMETEFKMGHSFYYCFDCRRYINAAGIGKMMTCQLNFNQE